MVDITDALVAISSGTIMSIEVSAGSKAAVFPSGYNPWRKAIGCQVSAQPIGGKANIAIIRLIASVLNIPDRDVSIVAGMTSSQKKVHISGLSIDEISTKIGTLLPGKSGG